MEQTPKKINVIEYKDKLFKTQEEYNEFRRNELKETLYSVTNSKLKAEQFLQILINNTINTKAKLEALQQEIKSDRINNFGLNEENGFKEPEDEITADEKELETF